MKTTLLSGNYDKMQDIPRSISKNKKSEQDRSLESDTIRSISMHIQQYFSVRMPQRWEIGQNIIHKMYFAQIEALEFDSMILCLEFGYEEE